VGFLIGEQLTGLEEAGAFAQKALSVFIPAPRAAPGFTNPLSEAHWRKGEYAKAISCEAWYRGKRAADEAGFASDPMVIEILKTGADTDVRTEARLITAGQARGYTEYGGQRALEGFGWGMPPELFKQSIEKDKLYYLLIGERYNASMVANSVAWKMRDDALYLYDSGKRGEAKAIIDKIAWLRQDLIKAGRLDLARSFSPESLSYEIVRESREDLFKPQEVMEPDKKPLEDNIYNEQFMDDLALSQWEADGGVATNGAILQGDTLSPAGQPGESNQVRNGPEPFDPRESINAAKLPEDSHDWDEDQPDVVSTSDNSLGMLGTAGDGEKPDNKDEYSSANQKHQNSIHNQSPSLLRAVATTNVTIKNAIPATKTSIRNGAPGINWPMTNAANTSFPRSYKALANSDRCDLPNVTIKQTLPQDITYVKEITPSQPANGAIPQGGTLSPAAEEPAAPSANSSIELGEKPVTDTDIPPAGQPDKSNQVRADLPVARHLLFLLGLESPEQISGATSVQRIGEKDGLVIFRIEIPEYGEDAALPQGGPAASRRGLAKGGLALLRLILLEESKVKKGSLIADLLYDKSDRLIAIFPVRIGDARGSFLYLRYLNLSPYYFSSPKPYDPESLSKWNEFLLQLKEDKALINYYKSKNYSPARLMKDSGASQYVHLSFFEEGGRWAAEPILRVGEEGIELSRENIPLKRYPQVHNAVIAVLPTVYNPVFKQEHDESFYRFLISEAGYRRRFIKGRKPLIEKGSICLDPAAGSGAMTWLLSILTGRKVYAIEESPVAALNLRYNARQIGFPAEVICAGTMVGPDGRGWFAERIDLIIGNGPGFITDGIDKESLPLVLSGLWDNDNEGERFLKPLVNALPKVASRAILWNQPCPEERDGVLRDRVIEAITAATPAGYEMQVDPVPLVFNNAAYVITPVKSKSVTVTDFDTEQTGKEAPGRDRERDVAVDFRDVIIDEEKKIREMTARQEEKAGISEERLIVALGTRWIPGYREGARSPYYKDLNGLIVSMRKFCEERGIPLIDRDDGELLNEIAILKSRKEYANAKVVVLAGEDSLNNGLLLLQSTKDTFLFGVDRSNLADDSYIHLVEMLEIAVKFAVTDILPRNDSKLPIERRANFWVFVPRADRVLDGDTLRRLYEIQKFA
ncbi:MAG: hypothetical protein Q8N91_06515, partial [Candidatus Omnitrophota bacterium]|nr:hypothetical protein [Candidatus Omnitrophota bacterium]